MRGISALILSLLVLPMGGAHAGDGGRGSDVSDIKKKAAADGRTPTAARTVSDFLDRAREIRFGPAESRPSESSLALLEALAAALVREDVAAIEIVSHTAASGDPKKDLALSQQRADAVKSILVAQGVAAERLVTTGRGSEDPLAPNLTQTGRRRNDRIELHRTRAGTKR